MISPKADIAAAGTRANRDAWSGFFDLVVDEAEAFPRFPGVRAPDFAARPDRVLEDVPVFSALAAGFAGLLAGTGWTALTLDESFTDASLVAADAAAEEVVFAEEVTLPFSSIRLELDIISPPIYI
jgi:hypothetical protein